MTTQNTARFRPSALPLLIAATVAAGTPTVHAQAGRDWPQWRGPDRTGVSLETGWSPTGRAEPLWTKELGLGHASFAVAGGRVYTLGYDADAGLDSVWCFDAATGAELWRHRYAAEIWDVAHDGGALTTPTVVGDAVYTSNREGKVFCLDAATGAVRWSRDLRADLEVEPPTWGFSASPLVVDDRVVLNVDHVVALDRATGADAWVTDERFGISYSTPAAFELDGRAYLAVLNGSGLRVLARESGAQVAFHPWSKDPEIYPATPVVIGDRIFISAGYDRGCTMLRFGVDASGAGALTELWSSRAMRNKMSGSILHEGHLFGFDESILKCIDLDGNLRWRERGLGTGSMSIVGDRLVILDGRGNVIVAEADPEGYAELSRQKVLDGGTSWSTPVLSHGRVYCRSSLGQMACLDYSGGAADPAVATGAASAELPDAAAILARHVAAVRGADALERVKSVHMRGTTQSLINTVRSGAVDLSWDAERGFAWSDEAGLRFGHGAEFGWLIQPRSPPAVLRDEPLEALRLAGDFTVLFDPARGYADLETRASRVFEGRPCFALSGKTAGGQERTLYFEVATGLFAGHEGEGSALWTLDDYREFDGVRLPTRWSRYEPEKGEMAVATFEEVTVNPKPDPERFAVPAAVAPFLRTPEEVVRDTERLERLHAAILGDWVPEDAPDETLTFLVADGFLVLDQGGGDTTHMAEPDEHGVFALLGVPFVTFTPVKDDTGAVVALQVDVGGAPEERFVRPAQ